MHRPRGSGPPWDHPGRGGMPFNQRGFPPRGPGPNFNQRPPGPNPGFNRGGPRFPPRFPSGDDSRGGFRGPRPNFRGRGGNFGGNPNFPDFSPEQSSIGHNEMRSGPPNTEQGFDGPGFDSFPGEQFNKNFETFPKRGRFESHDFRGDHRGTGERGRGFGRPQTGSSFKQQFPEPIEPVFDPKREPDFDNFGFNPKNELDNRPSTSKIIVNKTSPDWYNSDLELQIDPTNFCSARARSDGGFAHLWAGAKATYGATTGKVCFEVRIDSNNDTSHIDDDPNPNLTRIGWSIADASINLGEEPLSFGFGGTGKASTRKNFRDYGRRFGVGDVIGCFLDFTGFNVKIVYSLNGNNLGVAFEVNKNELAGRALFPHVFTKNQNFTVNFGQMAASMALLIPGFVPIGQLEIKEGLVRGPVAPATTDDCEVLMMVGLPGSGKTYWSEKWAREHPEKRYNILGTNVYLDRMKVMNLKRWRNYHGRWDVLITSCTECFDKILKVACKRKRNYILDQTNVFPTARIRKLSDFRGFSLKAVVVVPSNDEYIRRSAIRAQEEGKEVPEEAVLNMKANFVLPGVKEPFADVWFTDLPPEESNLIVEQYNAEAISKGCKMTGGVKDYIKRNRKENNKQQGVTTTIGRFIGEPNSRTFENNPQQGQSYPKPEQIFGQGPPAGNTYGSNRVDDGSGFGQKQFIQTKPEWQHPQNAPRPNFSGPGPMGPPRFENFRPRFPESQNQFPPPKFERPGLNQVRPQFAAPFDHPRPAHPGPANVRWSGPSETPPQQSRTGTNDRNRDFKGSFGSPQSGPTESIWSHQDQPEPQRFQPRFDDLSSSHSRRSGSFESPTQSRPQQDSSRSSWGNQDRSKPGPPFRPEQEDRQAHYRGPGTFDGPMQTPTISRDSWGKQTSPHGLLSDQDNSRFQGLVGTRPPQQGEAGKIWNNQGSLRTNWDNMDQPPEDRLRVSGSFEPSRDRQGPSVAREDWSNNSRRPGSFQSGPGRDTWSEQGPSSRTGQDRQPPNFDHRGGKRLSDSGAEAGPPKAAKPYHGADHYSTHPPPSNPSTSSSAPDYEALMQHMAYYQSQMTAELQRRSQL